MRDILDIQIVFEKTVQIETEEKAVKLIYFSGSCETEYFSGTVLQGGIDTQILTGSGGTVSARYVLEGTDAAGIPCRIFVENEGVLNEAGEMRTKPKFVTDSHELSWLNNSELKCRFFMEDSKFHVIMYVDEMKKG